MRLGLGLSGKQYDMLFDRVDLNKDGAINTGQFIAWVSGAQMKAPPGAALSAKLDVLRQTIRKHLGSAENAFLWFLKKHKLPDDKRGLSVAEFETLLLNDLAVLLNRPVRLGPAEVEQAYMKVRWHFLVLWALAF